MRRVKSVLGVLILVVGCSMILWPGVLTPSAVTDDGLSSTISTTESQAASLDQFLAALGVDGGEAVDMSTGTEQMTVEIEEIADVD